MDKTKMGRRKKKAAGSSEPETVTLPISGITDSTHVNGDSGFSIFNDNGNEPLIASPYPASSVQNSSVQTPPVTDEAGEVNGGDDGDRGEINAAGDVSASEQTKLDEGFFEVESILRKRVRKVFFSSSAIVATCFIFLELVRISFFYRFLCLWNDTRM